METAADYPDVLPEIRVEVNEEVFAEATEKIEQATNTLNECTTELMGMPMTSNLIELLRDQLQTWSIRTTKDSNDPAGISLWEEAQKRGKEEDFSATETPDESKVDSSSRLPTNVDATDKMTKTQKRRHLDKFGANRGQYRGWDWVDVLSHLRKTGNSDG